VQVSLIALSKFVPDSFLDGLNFSDMALKGRGIERQCPNRVQRYLIDSLDVPRPDARSADAIDGLGQQDITQAWIESRALSNEIVQGAA